MDEIEDDRANLFSHPEGKTCLSLQGFFFKLLRMLVLILKNLSFSFKKPPLKREDSFLKRFSSRQIPETQETVEDTGSEGQGGDPPRRRRRFRKQPRTVVNPDSNFYFYWLLVLTVCVLYNMWTLIVRQSFPELQTLVCDY